jgi:hypothetical protein
MDELRGRLEAYIEGLRRRGEKIPGDREGKEPNFRVIAAGAQINRRLLAAKQYRTRINLAVKELGLTPALTSSTFDRNAALLTSYLQNLAGRGAKLPEDPNRKGKLYLEQIEIEAGLVQATLRATASKSAEADAAKLRAIVEKSLPSLGVELRILPTLPEAKDSRIDYRQLLARGTEHREYELRDKKAAAQQLYNTRWALNRFLKDLKLTEDSQIGGEFVDEFETTVSKVLGKMDSAGTRKKFHREIHWWHDFYHRLLAGEALPGDFHEAFAYLADRSGLPRDLLPKLAGVPHSTFQGWYYGTVTPSRLCSGHLTRIETLFKLPVGALSGRVVGGLIGGCFRLSQLPECLRENPELAKRIKPHLPDCFLDLPADTQMEIVESIRHDILKSRDPYAIKLAELLKLPYKLKEWPEQPAQEFREFAAFKMAVRPPLGMKRNGKWRPHTKDKWEMDFSYFFGALLLPQDAEDVRLRGIGMNPSNLTLALVACPTLVDWYIRFRCEACNKYTRYVLGLLQEYRSMLRAGTGWLRQRPWLASRLRPISIDSVELISPELVRKAQSDWDGVCDDAIHRYHELTAEVKELVEVARDPFFRIKGITDMEDPIEALEQLIRGMKGVKYNPHTQPLFYHLALRNRALVSLMAVTGLRSYTVEQLDYTGDDTGHLKPVNGGYVLDIPRSFFKMEDSPFFGPENAREDYHAELPDVFDFNETMEEYLTRSRPWLLNTFYPNEKSQPLFVHSAGARSARMTVKNMHKALKAETERHLVENKWRGTGIRLVEAFGPHAIRHIRGTAAVKKTGSFQVAGDANQNTAKTAEKHYARFIPKDRTRRANSILFSKKPDKKDIEETEPRRTRQRVRRTGTTKKLYS